MPLYEQYDQLGADLSPVSTPPADGEPWKAPEDLPANFPSRPGPSPESGTNEPTLFGEDIDFVVKRPLILVPGILATQLVHYDESGRGHYNERTVWPPVNLASGRSVSLNNLKLNEIKPIETSNNPLVPGAYDELISFLCDELHYKLDDTLFIFGYNWTQSNKISGQRLAGFIKLVESRFYGSGVPTADRKIDIICHSMGGLVTRSAIRIWGASVTRTIYLASPHYGAPKAYGVLHPLMRRVPFIYDFLATWRTNLSPDQSLDDELRDVAKQCESAYELLPDVNHFQAQPNLAQILDPAFPTTPAGLEETYYQNDDSKLSEAPRVRVAMDFKKRLGRGLPGKQYYVIVSNSLETENRATFYASFVNPFASADRGWMGTVGGTPNGDGTVPFISGRGPDLYDQVTGAHTVMPNVRETFFLIALYLKSTQ